MKAIKLLLLIAVLFVSVGQAQTADEIIETYFENIGGKENLAKLKSFKMDGAIKFGNVEIPFEAIETKEGLSILKANFQGQEFFQKVFDGNTLWNTNQMTMAAEKSDSETTENHKKGLKDFPSEFLNYKEKGYTLELIGKETVEGTETFKIKLVKEPLMVDGNEVQNVNFYYFETENFVPIMKESAVHTGPMAGQTSQTKLSDYQEVEGLYFPFSITELIKGNPQGQEITISKISLNIEVDKNDFKFPETNKVQEPVKNN